MSNDGEDADNSGDNDNPPTTAGIAAQRPDGAAVAGRGEAFGAPVGGLLSH